MKDEREKSVIFYAADSNSPQKIGELIKFSTDVNLRDKTGKIPLLAFLAIMHSLPCEPETMGRVIQVVKTLLDAGGEVTTADYSGATVLHKAAEAAPLEVMRIVLEAGVDVNVVDGNGMTALHLVACTQSTSIDKLVSLRLEHGANGNLQDKDGKTAFHYLLSRRYRTHSSHVISLMSILIESGTDINAVDREGKTAHHMVPYEESAFRDKVFLFLFENGANGNLQDNAGKTALHCVAEILHSSNAISTLRLLLESGTDVNLVDCRGRTVLHVVVTYRQCSAKAEILDFLLRHGADASIAGNAGNAPLMYMGSTVVTKNTVLYIGIPFTVSIYRLLWK